MSKVNLNLENYPELSNLFANNKEEFSRVLKGIMTHADMALEERFDYAKEVYKMDYLEMFEAVMDTFYDVSGIADQHHNDAEARGLTHLGPDLHPLAIFTNGATVYNSSGENVTPAKWIEQDEFDLKNWLYALFYGARFVSWKELSEYLSLSKYELVDALKAHNFQSLKDLQPQLQEQKEKGIPVGKLIPGTGRLALGED